MITGFNTDIEHQGVTYHVQTEDKGVATPLILSLVYNRGTILASKRSPYDDLLLPTFNEKALTERLQKQHTLMCAAVRAGRLDDLKRMTAKESAARQRATIAQKAVEPVAEKPALEKPVVEKIEIPIRQSEPVLPTFARVKSEAEEIPPPPPVFREKFQAGNRLKEVELDLPLLELPNIPAAKKSAPKSQPPKRETRPDIPVSAPENELVIDAVEIVEEEIILPAEAVVIITDFDKPERATPGKLKIELPLNISFKGGERKTFNILVRRGDSERGIGAAHISVKVLGASFSPLISQAKTNADGIAAIDLELPSFRAGRAAIIIKAMCDGDETELRRVIRQG